MGPLLPDEIKQLLLALNSAFPGPDDLEELTLFKLNTRLADITSIEKTPTMIKRIIVWADKSGRSEELIRAAMSCEPGNELLQIVGQDILNRMNRSELASWYRPPVDPYETCFIPAQEDGLQAFISRRKLRDFTRHLRTPLGLPVLVVNGTTQTGKTYSFQLVAYIKRAFRAQGAQSYGVALIDLVDEIQSKYLPEMLAADIADQLGWDTASITKRPSTRYVKELCRWLVGQSNQRDETVVVILDGFHHMDLYGETRDMIQEFVRQVSANTSNIGLLLLNFPRELVPRKLLGPIQYEDVAALTTAEVTEFFGTLYKQKGHKPDSNVIDLIVAPVIAAVAPGDPDYNSLLNRSVTDAARKLK